MQPDAGGEDVRRVVAAIRAKGLTEHVSRGRECTLVGAIGDERVFDRAEIEALPKVARAIRIVSDWRLAGREAWPDGDTLIRIRGTVFGGGALRRVCRADGNAAEAAGVWLDPFRVAANPYAPPLSGSLDAAALADAVRQNQAAGKVAFVRIRDGRDIETVLAAGADVVCLGGEMMENRSLLQELGCLNVPVVVCKNRHHGVSDWLTAAEQVLLRGNMHVFLGEAGTLSLNSPHLRLDTDAIVQAKCLSHLPVLADVSALAHRYMDTGTLLKLATAAGADVVVA